MSSYGISLSRLKKLRHIPQSYVCHKKYSYRKTSDAKQPWPLLPLNIVKAIVDETHNQGRKVTAHIGEATGAKIAVDASIDEWAHLPCATIPDSLAEKSGGAQYKSSHYDRCLIEMSGCRCQCPNLGGFGWRAYFHDTDDRHAAY